jgi:hypothetical protein
MKKHLDTSMPNSCFASALCDGWIAENTTRDKEAVTCPLCIELINKKEG